MGKLPGGWRWALSLEAGPRWWPSLGEHVRGGEVLFGYRLAMVRDASVPLSVAGTPSLLGIPTLRNEETEAQLMPRMSYQTKSPYTFSRSAQ